MTESDFATLQVNAQKELTIRDDQSALTISRCLPRLLQYYLGLLATETRVLKKLSIQHDRLYHKLYHKTKFGDDVEHSNSAREFEVYINANEEMVVVNSDLALQQSIVTYLEGTVDNIRKLPFSLKNYIELKRFLEGN